MAKFVAHLLFFSLLITLIIRVAKCDPLVSCSQTPHPNVCSSMIGANLFSSQDNSPSGLLARVVGATMERAMQGHELATAADMAKLDWRVRVAWADCMELWADTVGKLNRTMGSEGPVGYADKQTWLSAAMANDQACRDGFMELGVLSGLAASPFMSGNLSESLSNSLAIINEMAPAKSGGNRRLLVDGFPDWVSTADRKLLQSSSIKANLVVAQDGSGNYKTITEAVQASVKLRSGTSRFVIHVKGGVYKENVEIASSMKNLMFVGDGIDTTVVTGSKNVQDGSTTFKSATFGIVGDGFIAQDMTFENTAGPGKHQAVALRSGSDLSVFYRCSFKGYQDTLYTYSQRQFYRNCDVYGTVDFIFGDAAVVLQSCNIYLRKPMSGQQNTVTAQGRSDPNENTGISIHDSAVAAASDLKPVQSSVKSYLGRPWKQYSRTVFMKTSLDSSINPAGWLEWSGNFALSTLYYGEYMNSGSGAATGGRVKWPGYHVIASAAEAGKFTVGSFLSGDSWLPATGVPYTSGL